VEAVEHRFALVFGDPRSRVVDPELDAMTGAANGHFDAATLSGELARVVDEYSGRSSPSMPAP
jgi:hypothetical protein